MKFIPVDHREALTEGEVPKSYHVERDKDGNERLYEIVLEPEDYNTDDDIVRDTETYYLDDEEEYWGFQTVCKACGAKFQAYDSSWHPIRNYCPGCGKKL